METFFFFTKIGKQCFLQYFDIICFPLGKRYMKLNFSFSCVHCFYCENIFAFKKCIIQHENPFMFWSLNIWDFFILVARLFDFLIQIFFSRVFPTKCKPVTTLLISFFRCKVYRKVIFCQFLNYSNHIVLHSENSIIQAHILEYIDEKHVSCKYLIQRE